MASEATKMALRGNMHMDTRVIKVSDVKFEVKLDYFHCPCPPKSIGPFIALWFIRGQTPKYRSISMN